MEQFDIPILKQTCKLYKLFHDHRNNLSKQDRYTLWQQCENLVLEVLENILWASYLSKSEKLPVLEKTSIRLNLLRALVRLCKEVKAIDNRKYILLQEIVDEIGRMLGGWIKSTKD